MGWGQNNVNQALDNSNPDDAVISNGGGVEKKSAKKWGFGKPKTVEVGDKKKEKDEKEKEGEGAESTKLDAPPVGLFETVR
jgi:hypothetical protein